MSALALEFGVRAHDFGAAPAGELASRIRAAGFGLAQLAPAKALAAPPPDDGNYRGLARAIADGFQAGGVRVAVLGCYVNPVDDDPERRETALASFDRHLRIASLLGDGGLAAGSVYGGAGPLAPPPVGTETGWSDAGRTRSPESMRLLLRGLERLLRTAEETGGAVAIEGVCRHVIWRPRILGEVLRTMASPRLVAIYDPVNYVDETNWRDQDRLIEEAFDSFGGSIAAVHAKDFLLAGGMRTCPAGDGLLNWPLALRRLAELRRGREGKPLPFLLEDTRPSDLGRARSRMEAIASGL